MNSSKSKPSLPAPSYPKPSTIHEELLLSGFGLLLGFSPPAVAQDVRFSGLWEGQLIEVPTPRGLLRKYRGSGNIVVNLYCGDKGTFLPMFTSYADPLTFYAASEFALYEG